MTASTAFRTHDLLQFRVTEYHHEVPDWVDRNANSAWAVVRRHEPSRDGMIPVGLRGRERSERTAIEIHESDILRAVPPEELTSPIAAGLPAPGIHESLETISANSATWLGPLAWGPTGSVGFQLATRLPVVRESSDLDIILRADHVIAPADARAILDRMSALPCRVDCLIETPRGAVALMEWAASTDSEVLLRTTAGPRLTRDPWDMNANGPASA